MSASASYAAYWAGAAVSSDGSDTEADYSAGVSGDECAVSGAGVDSADESS